MTFNSILVLASFSLAVSGCDNVEKMYPDMYDQMIKSRALIESNNINNQKQQHDINYLPADSNTQIKWSSLNRNEQVNEIKSIVVSYGGELQGLGYSDAKILETADIYVLNTDISDAKRLQLNKTLSELVGAPIVINILDSRVIAEMGNLETLELSAIAQNQIANFSIYNDEHVNAVARIVEMHGAKLQSLAYDLDDAKLSLSISYYPKKFTQSDFENLEEELRQLTGVNVTVFRKSVSIKPL